MIKIKSLVQVVITGALMGVLPALAQQQVTHTQHGQQRVPLNSATSLLSPTGEIQVMARRQWMGVEGAPQVLWGSAHIGMQNIKATAGVNFRQERMGVERLSEASLFFAKSVRLSARDYLGVSLNAGLAYFQGNYSSLDPTDPAFRDEMETEALAGFGVLFYRPGRYYAGVSLPRLSLGSLRDDASRYAFGNVYHVHGGALLGLGGDMALRPSVLATYTEDFGTQVEASALVVLKEQLGLGLNVRSTGELAGMAQFHFGSFGLGYSYQFMPGSGTLNRRMNNATHDLGISYRFGGLIQWL